MIWFRFSVENSTCACTHTLGKPHTRLDVGSKSEESNKSWKQSKKKEKRRTAAAAAAVAGNSNKSRVWRSYKIQTQSWRTVIMKIPYYVILPSYFAYALGFIFGHLRDFVSFFRNHVDKPPKVRILGTQPTHPPTQFFLSSICQQAFLNLHLLLLLQFALQMFDDWLMMHFAPFLNILCIGNTTNFVGKLYIYMYIYNSKW